MSTAQIVPVLLALLTANLVAQVKPPKNSVFTCAMHPQLQLGEKGACPICGMDLFAAAPTPEKIQIAPGGLRAYCEEYVKEALERRERGGSAYRMVAAHVALRGKDWRKKLRGLLEVAEQDWLSAAAAHLGELQDQESIPLLKKLLADDALAITQDYFCPEHPKVTAEAAGKCRKCGKPLLSSMENLLEQLSIAGALHEMGVEEGLRALEKIAEKCTFAYSAMALRDSPRVRKLLAAEAKAESEHRRSEAIMAQLRLGLDEGLKEAVRLLASSRPEVRGTVIAGLGASGMKRAIEPLQRIVRDDGLSRSERVLAAQSLVKLGERKYVGFLMDAFHKTTGTTDRLIYHALGDVGDGSVLPLLETAIENGRNRSCAVAAAARILGREATKAEKK